MLSVDVGAIVDGYYGDNARDLRRRHDLRRGAAAARRDRGVARGRNRAVRARATASSTSAHAVQAVAEAAGFSVVREYVGHGIGRAMHEDPNVPNYGTAGQGPAARGRAWSWRSSRWSTSGQAAVESLPDGWTVVTQGRLAVGALRAHGGDHRGRSADSDGGVDRRVSVGE